MQEIKKNQHIVKLEPKPVKIEGKLLDLKNKGTGFRVKPWITKRNPEIMKKTEIPVFAEMTEVNKGIDDRGKSSKENGITWQVEEAGNGGKFPLAGKLIIFVLLLTAAAGFIMKSPIMVLTFLLFVIVFYVFMKKGKRSVNVSVDFRGIGIDNSIYSYDKLKSFWVFYDPPYEKYLSIGTKSTLSPFVRIKLGAQNPVELRSYLLSYLVEAEHPAPFLEIMMERFGL